MFKEQYKKDNEMVNPSREFLDKLKTEMKKEERSKGSNRKHISHKNYAGRKVFAAAAAIALIVIGAGSYNKIFDFHKNNIMQPAEISEDNGQNNNDKNSGSIGNYSENEENQLFSNSSWYDSNMTSEEIYKIFIKRISSEDDLKELTVSSTNDFTNGKVMDKSSVNKLADSLKSAALIKDDSYVEEKPEYYMAAFNNGDIIKFVIYDNRYFECSEFEGIFLIVN